MTEHLHQQLNEQLRDAMLAFYLTYGVPADPTLEATPWNDRLATADDLYRYWLLDVQVSQAVPTSRVASAIASLQQYLNAIALGLEPGYDTRGMSAPQQATWRDSLHAYSLWRTRQQLRHFPANYLSPMLRSHKTESFQQLENDLNQCRLQPDSVLPAIQRYLTRFEEVANLKTLNGYIDGAPDDFANSTYYFVARSATDGTCHWRSLDMARRCVPPGAEGSPRHKQDTAPSGAWSEWKRIPLPASHNIPEHSIRPVLFNNRLFVIWAQCLSPTATGNSTEHLRSDPDESEKQYKARLQDWLKSRFIQFRLHFCYLKYDGSWSVPQVCSDEYCVMKELNKLDAHALKQATSTFAVLDSSTRPPSLCLGLNAHATPRQSAGRDYTRSDFFQAVRIDQDLSIEPLFSKGTVVDLKAHADHEKLAKRYLSLFIYNNHSHFNFHAPLSETVAVTNLRDSTPQPVPAGWNFDEQQGFISDLNSDSDVVFNTTSCVLEVTSRLKQPFPEHRTIALKARNSWAELSLNLTLLRALNDSNDKSALQTGSWLNLKTDITPPCNWVSLSVTCNKTGLHYANLIYQRADDALGTAQPLQLLPLRRDWETQFKGRYIERDAFDFMFKNSNTEYTLAVHFHTQPASRADEQNDWVLNNAWATLYARHYKPVILIPRHENTPHPFNIHRENTFMVGEPNTSRRELKGTSPALAATSTFSAHIQLDPKTMRPDEEQSHLDGSGPRPITVLHGVLTFDTDTRHNERIIRGYALKAVNLTLDPENTRPLTPVAPRILRRLSPSAGTAEFIDFSASSLKHSDNALTPRAPIRMNTGVCRQLTAAASVSLDTLFSMNASQWLEPPLNEQDAPQPLDFHGAHGTYFWELFLYLPWLVAWRLNMEQRHAEAETWLQYLFDPARPGAVDGAHTGYWKLHALTPVAAELSYARDNPHDPNQVALSAPVYFRQALYLLYLDILLNRGDAAYRQASADSLAEAKLWYVRAANLLGPRPNITHADPWQPVTLHELSASTSDTLRQLELATADSGVLCRAPASDPHSPLAQDSANLRLPLNPDLIARWDTLENRLHNLRHHLSIAGKPLQPDLFAPALAPHALLGRNALGSGPDSALALGSQVSDTGHYRFQVAYRQAMTMVDNLVQLGSTLLLLFERKEQAELMELQQHQAWDLARIALDQQTQNLAVDEKNRQALLAGRHIIEGRLKHFEKLLKDGISSPEARASEHYLASAQWDTAASTAQAGAGLAMLVPNIFGTSNGGIRFEGAFHAIQASAQGVANEQRATAAHLDRSEHFNRRAQDWGHALEQCQLELNQVDLQLQAQAEQGATLRLQLRHGETVMEQARLTYALLNKRFSNTHLYQWLNSQLAAFYYQAYDAAYAMCLTAQACWQFERADWRTRFIHGNPWNNQYRGMTAGESLKLYLLNMNTAYFQHNQRELEITRTVSLRQLSGKDPGVTANKNWAQLGAELLNSGTLDFELSRALFEADYPGHYLRRIKSISVSIPAVLGPYDDIRATLTQTWNQTQLSENPNDTRENLRVREQIVLSTGLNDSGLFTLNFDADERYLPFEFTGAISRWRLAFPNHASQLAMLGSLSDIIVHVRYTARSGGDRS